MDKYAKLIEALRGATSVSTLPIVAAQVSEITGDTCSVMLGELELTDVRLKASVGGSDRVMAIPRVGSTVLLGSLTGDLKELAVLKADEVERWSYEQGGLKIEIDSTDGRVSLANNSVSLVDVLQELANLLKQFKVLTPSGPSAGLVPDTLTAVTKFETDFKMLLK